MAGQWGRSSLPFLTSSYDGPVVGEVFQKRHSFMLQHAHHLLKSQSPESCLLASAVNRWTAQAAFAFEAFVPVPGPAQPAPEGFRLAQQAPLVVRVQRGNGAHGLHKLLCSSMLQLGSESCLPCLGFPAGSTHGRPSTRLRVAGPE